MSNAKRHSRLLLLTSVLLVIIHGKTTVAQRRTRVPCPGGCVCLITTVRCMHRRLTAIPRVPEETMILDLRFNHIRDIDPNAFAGLRNLHTILLNNNRIRRIPTEAFKGLTTLKHLYLYKNRISDIDKNAFKGLVSLEQLYIYNNDISSLEVGTFSNLPKLERLFLHYNMLTTLHEGLLDGLDSLRRLRLDNNHLMCDCDLLWFSKLLLRLGGNLQSTATCHEPRLLLGRSISSVSLDEFICSAPVITSEPRSMQVQPRETIYLSCTASGSPKPKVVWFHNGELIGEDSTHTLSIGGSLIIMNPSERDAGTYRCRAINTIGSTDSREIQVVYEGSVIGPPFFITRPFDVNVRANEPTALDCGAAGSPEPDITWFKDGRRLETRDNIRILESGSLHFRRTTPADNGTYTCLASNSLGQVNTTAVVFVSSPPSFTTRPRDVEVVQGDSGTITCRYRGNPAVTVVWLKDGRRLQRDQRYLVMETGDLLIRVVNPSDNGRYSCRLQNSIGTAEAHAFLTIRVPPQITVRPRSQRVREGGSVDFECEATGNPRPHIIWTKNNRAIPVDDKHTVLRSGALRVSRIDAFDAGVYRCEAGSSLGSRHADASLEIITQQQLEFVRQPTDIEVDSGTRIGIPCEIRTRGNGVTNDVTISWAKDSVGIVSSDERYEISSAPASYLTILDVGRDDAGRYECIARSGSSVIRASMTLRVNVRSSREEIVSKLLDILPPGCLERGCREQDTQSESLENFDNFGDDAINNFVRNQLGLDGNSRQKRQAISDFNELSNGINIVSRNVDRGINTTIRDLNNGGSRQSPGDLLALMRFPSTRRGVNMMRAAEVFEVSLRLIECCVKQGMKLKVFALDRNLFPEVQQRTDSPTVPESRTATLDRTTPANDRVSPPVIGTEVVAIIANLSGCSAHQKVPDCSERICFHRKYRTADGTCNNLQHPMWGASLTPFHRLLKPIYENGFNAPVGWDPQKLYHGHTLPSPRRVSFEVLKSREPRPSTDHDFTHMTMQWGQFIDHDLDFTTMAPSIKRFSDGVACRDSCDHDAPCFPIEVNSNDPRHRSFHHHATHHGRRPDNNLDGESPRCMEFTRSSAVCGSGITSVFFSALSRREQINQITSYQDASNVYGSTEEETKNLRDLSNDLGLLKEGQPLEQGQKPLLPYNILSDLDLESTEIRPVAPIECRRGDDESSLERSVPCFLCGDLRCNEQVSLTAMHTMWMREHNRIARKLKEINDQWDGNTIFNEARKIVGAEMQHITYSHWLPKILGPYMETIGDYRMYNPNLPSSVVNVFATAAFRFGHTMINPMMFRLNESWSETEHGNLLLHQAFFAPYRIIHEGGIDPLIRGLIAKPMKARDSDSNMNSELTERLFELAEEVALDLGALNVQRGRDHALPFYNEWREMCNLTRAQTFDDLAGEISNAEVRQRLQNVYGTPANIDPFVGMILEDITPGSRLGPTLGCILAHQFMRVRDGDRFWYENPGTFSPAQLTEIRQISLARIVCDNSDSISSVPKDVFRNVPVSEFVSCEELPRVDLRAWTECCDSCNENGDGNTETLSGHFRQGRQRTKRSAKETESDATHQSSNRQRLKTKRGKASRQKPSISQYDQKRMFGKLVGSKVVSVESNLDEITSKMVNERGEKEVERSLKLLAMNEANKLNMDRASFDVTAENGNEMVGKVLKVIRDLEYKVESLQLEVERLQGKVKEDS